jgi:hypothetical protein
LAKGAAKKIRRRDERCLSFPVKLNKNAVVRDGMLFLASL